MVNAGFPLMASYGFEMVDGRRPAHFAALRESSIEYLRRIQSSAFFAKISAI